jgi:hypothetical protein
VSKKKGGEGISCPIGRILSNLEDALDGKSEFMEHLTRSRIEFLKAIRCLVDDKIDRLEKSGPATGKKKMTKIKVE